MKDIILVFITAVSTITAIVLGVKNYRLGQRNTALQSRLVTLEESREADRAREANRADVIANILRNSEAPRWQCELENRGQCEARDVNVLLDGDPILEHPALRLATKQGLNTDLEYLAPGARFRYVLSPNLSCRPPWKLNISWSDDSGETGSYRTTLTF